MLRLVEGRQRVGISDRRRQARSASGGRGSRIANLACGRVSRQASERSFAVRLSPRAKIRMPAMASRGRVSAGAFTSNSGSTRSAQSAAQNPTSRRSSWLNIILRSPRSVASGAALRPGIYPIFAGKFPSTGVADKMNG